jgi:large repetitive protein
VKWRRSGAWAGLILALASLAAIVVAATQALGLPATRATTNDGGAWLPGRTHGAVFHLNHDVVQASGSVRVAPAGSDFDVDQADGVVVVRNAVEGSVQLIDQRSFQIGPTMAVPPTAAVRAVDHGVVVWTDAPLSVWRLSVDELAETGDLIQTAPLLTAAVPGRVVVAPDGSVGAVTEDGSVLRIQPDGSTTTKRPGTVSAKLRDLTIVGDRLVVLDERGTFTTLRGGDVSTFTLGAEASGLTLQQPGPANTMLTAVSPDGDIFEIDLDGGSGRAEAEAPPLLPLAPISHDGCVHALGAEPLSWVIRCGDGEPVATPLERAGPNLRLRLVNGWVWVNDIDNSEAWTRDDDGNVLRVQDWTAALPKDQDSTLEEEREGGRLEQTVGDDPDTAELERADNPDTDDRNDPPVAEPDSTATRVDRPSVIDVLANDTDPDGDLLMVTSVHNGDPGHSLVTVTADRRAVQVTPQAGFIGSLRYSYSISDGRGGTDTADGVLSVVGPETNHPPVAKSDVAATRAGRPISVDVLLNDSDPDGDALVLTGAHGEGGTVVHTADGIVTFTPDITEQQPTRTIAYTVADELGLQVEGRLVVNIRPLDANQAPDARNDAAVTVVGRALTIDLLANDTDPDGDALLVSGTPQIVQPAGGVAEMTMSPDGEFGFQAPSAGTWLLNYAVSDGANADTAQIRIEVAESAENRPPVAVRDDVVIPVGGSRTVYALANDGDPDGDVVGIVDWKGVDGLQIEEIEGFGFKVTVLPGAAGPVQFRYAISDGKADPVSAVVLVSISSAPAVDQPPVATADSLEVRSGGFAAADVLVNDRDPEGGPLRIEATSNTPEGVSVTIDGDSQKLRVVVAPGVAGSFVFGYDVSDEAGNRAAAEVRVRVIQPNEPNRPPVARADVLRTRAETEALVPVLDNDSDPDGDVLLVESIAAQPSHGTVSIEADGVVRYVPLPTFTGTDSFRYAVLDAQGLRAVGTVRVGVMPAPTQNRPPDARDDQLALVVGSGPTPLEVLVNDVDPDRDPLTVVDAEQPSRGSIEITEDGRAIRFDPPAEVGAAGTEISFRYTVDDGHGARDDAIVTVTVQQTAVPLPPIATADTAGPVRSGSAVSVAVLANDADPDGRREALRVSSTDPAVSVQPDGTVRITTGPSTATYPYRITDLDGLTADSTVTVVVVVNEAPTVLPLRVETPAGQPVTLSLADQARDPDGDALFFSCCRSAQGGTPSIRAAGENRLDVVFGPDPGFVGPATFAYTVDDQNGHVVAASVEVVVLPPENRPPTATSGAIEVEEGTNAIVALGAFASDPDESAGDSLTFKVNATSGDIAVSQAGPDEARVVAAKGTHGRSQQFTFVVTDEAGAAATGTVVVTATRTRTPPPVAVADTSTTNQGEQVVLTVLDNDIGAGLSIKQANATGSNSMSVDPNRRTLTFAPAADFFGTAPGTYTLVDENGREATGTVTVNVIGRPSPPGAPSGAADNATVTLTWTSPPSNGAPIDGYRITNDQGGTEEIGVANSYTWRGLTNGTAYRFQIAAHNQSGWSAAGPLSIALTPNTLPGKPAPPTVSFKDRSIDVTWTPPANDGSALTGYHLEIGGATSSVAQLGSVTTYTWQGLSNGSTYQFRVRSVNALGAGPFSEWSISEHPLREPDAPGGVTAARGSRVLTVTWAKPANNGDPIIEYEVKMLSSGASVKVPGENTLSYDWANLTNGVEQQFQVRARNRDADWSPWSGTSAPVKPCAAPDPPSAPSAVFGDKQVTVGWTPPNDQGCAITGYQITSSSGQTQSAAAGTPAHVFTGLTNGTSYTFTVRAINEVGTGAMSPTSAAVIPAGKPKAPTITAATPGVGQVALSWTPADPNGRSVTGYQVLVDGGAPFTIGPTTSHTVTGLQPAATYTFTVRGISEIGEGDLSAGRQARTFGPPAQMGAPALSAPPYGQVNATWSAPSSDARITSYEVHMNGVFQGNVGMATSHHFGGLADNTAYDVQVRACSAAGCGNWSGFARIVTPARASVTVAMGGSAQGKAGCSSSLCRDIIIVGMSNIGEPARIECVSTRDGTFWSFPSRTVAQYNAGPCYFGYGGHRAWVVVNGVKSNELQW